MSVVDRMDSTIKTGVLFAAGLVAGGLAANFVDVDGVPDMVLPAVAMAVLAIALYVANDT